MGGRLGWYVFQVAVVGTVLWLYAGPINQNAIAIGSPPTPPYVALFLGVALAALLTVILGKAFDLIRRLSQRR